MSAMSSSGVPFYAHSADAHGRWHPLAEHLRSVGTTAGQLAAGWEWADEARLAGLLHDLGKYGDLFQQRLRGETSGLDHWSTGALEAWQSHKSLGAALAIEGHHLGLQPASALAEQGLFALGYYQQLAELRGGTKSNGGDRGKEANE